MEANSASSVCLLSGFASGVVELGEFCNRVSGESSVRDNVLEWEENGNWLIVLIDGLYHFLYMYKRERVPILEGTCPFVNGPFEMLALSIKVTA